MVLLSEAWSARRDTHIRFLKLQVEMLQSRLPGNRVIPDPIERHRLMKIGAEMDHAVKHTLDIVSIKTYRRWLQEEHGGRQPGKVGRPRLTKSLRELILRLARENTGWGARRIIGELKKLAVKASRSSVRRVLPDPHRHACPYRIPRPSAIAGACGKCPSPTNRLRFRICGVADVVISSDLDVRKSDVCPPRQLGNGEPIAAPAAGCLEPESSPPTAAES